MCDSSHWLESTAAYLYLTSLHLLIWQLTQPIFGEWVQQISRGSRPWLPGILLISCHCLRSYCSQLLSLNAPSCSPPPAFLCSFSPVTCEHLRWPWVGVAEHELCASNTKVKDFIPPPPPQFLFVLWSQMAIQARHLF